MSSQDSHSKVESPSSRWLQATVVLPIAIVALSFLVGQHREQLLLGWLYFLTRTIPRVTVDPPSLVAGLIAILLFLGLVHGLGRSWNGRRMISSQGTSGQWTLSTSLCVCIGTMALFAAGTSAIGICHQVIWICTERGDQTELVTPTDLGWIAQSRDATLRTHAKNNLKQIGLAIHNYHDTYGSFPAGGTMSSDGTLLHGWMMAIGPFHSYTATSLDPNSSWRSDANSRFYTCQLDGLLNPSQRGALFDGDGFGLAHWAANVHVMPIVTINGALPETISSGLDSSSQPPHHRAPLGVSDSSGFRLDEITDGTSQTILVGSVGQNFLPWGHPANVRDPAHGINKVPNGFGGPPGWNGAMFLMCDGSVRFLPETTELSIMKALASPAGGDVVPNLDSINP